MDFQIIIMSNFNIIFLIFLSYFLQYDCKIHELKIKNDPREYISVSTFGFFKGGTLDVKLRQFHPNPLDVTDSFGFSIDRTMNDAVNPYLDTHQGKCFLDDKNYFEASNSAVVFLTMNLQTKQLTIKCNENMKSLLIVPHKEVLPKHIPPVASASQDNDPFPFDDSSETKTADAAQVSEDLGFITNGVCSQVLPIDVDKTGQFFNTSFTAFIPSEQEEGLYHLFFHNCRNYKFMKPRVKLDFILEIEERNVLNFLSAGEMPLPALYFSMSLIFFICGCFWMYVLLKSRHPVFKIHYLMASLVFLKTLSLLFHGINYHFIQARGERVATWAIIFYVIHLLKGSVLIITILLIGTGWTFIKYILSEKEKKIFMFAIPLQVLANIAYIIINESEEGDIEYRNWLDVFMLVDLFCCGAILFPVVWSIRHLQEASLTDGKAAINLRKLKLFRHFYIMIVCYVYFTRIIVYLLKITVPFQYEWLNELFHEVTILIFFTLSGYKFRPASANPYFQVNIDDDDDEEMDIVVSQCGVTEGLTKLSRMINEDEKDTSSLLASKRESSHEYD